MRGRGYGMEEGNQAQVQGRRNFLARLQQSKRAFESFEHGQGLPHPCKNVYREQLNFELKTSKPPIQSVSMGRVRVAFLREIGDGKKFKP